MERKAFLATAGGVAAALAASAAARAMPTPMLRARPLRGRSDRSDRNIRHVRSALDTLIGELERDQHDFCGHREQAVDLLQRARAQLTEALNCDVRNER